MAFTSQNIGTNILENLLPSFSGVVYQNAHQCITEDSSYNLCYEKIKPLKVL